MSESTLSSPAPPPASAWRMALVAAVFDGSLLYVAATRREAVDLIFASTFPLISAAIVAVFALGLTLTWMNLTRLWREDRALSTAVASLPGEGPTAAWALGLPAGSVRGRLLGLMARGAGRVGDDPAGRALVEDGEERAASWGRYATGVLTMLGLLGTFLGLMVAIEAMGGLLDLRDFDAFFDGVVGALDGMGTAFSTSLAGIALAIWLGFDQVLVHNAQVAYLGRLEAFVSRQMLPALAPQEGVGGLEIELARLRGAFEAWRLDTAEAGVDLRGAAEVFSSRAVIMAEASQAVLARLDERDAQWRRVEDQLDALRRLAEGENRVLLDLAHHRVGLGADSLPSQDEAMVMGDVGASSPSGPPSNPEIVGELRRMNELLASIYQQMGLTLRSSAAKLEGSQGEMSRLIQRLMQRSEHQGTQATHQILLLRNLLQYLGQDEGRLKQILEDVGAAPSRAGPGEG